MHVKKYRKYLLTLHESGLFDVVSKRWVRGLSNRQINHYIKNILRYSRDRRVSAGLRPPNRTRKQYAATLTNFVRTQMYLYNRRGK